MCLMSVSFGLFGFLFHFLKTIIILFFLNVKIIPKAYICYNYTLWKIAFVQTTCYTCSIFTTYASALIDTFKETVLLSRQWECQDHFKQISVNNKFKSALHQFCQALCNGDSQSVSFGIS